MSKINFTLYSDSLRRRVCELIMRAPQDARVTIQPPRRTLDQNAKLHAMIGDIAKQHRLAGRKLTTREWKTLFMATLGYHVEFLPELDGDGVVAVSPSTSDLGVTQCSDLIESIYSHGAEWGIVWSEPELWQHPTPIGEPSKVRDRRGDCPLPKL